MIADPTTPETTSILVDRSNRFTRRTMYPTVRPLACASSGRARCGVWRRGTLLTVRTRTPPSTPIVARLAHSVLDSVCREEIVESVDVDGRS